MIDFPALLRCILFALPALVAAGGAARGDSLGSFLPMAIPGFGVAPGVSARSRLHSGDFPVPLAPLASAGLEVFPRLAVDAGLDTAPGAGQGITAMGMVRPEVRLADPELGLAGFANAELDRYARDPAANANRVTAALGLALPFGPDRITLGAAHVSTAQTALGLAANGGAAPLDVTTDAGRIGLRLGFGAFDVTARVRFGRDHVAAGGAGPAGFGSRSITRGQVALETADGAPLRELLLLRAGTTRYAGALPGSGFADSSSLAVLAGGVTGARALWRLRVVGGAERIRYAEGGPASGIAVVGDLALQWTPDPLIAVDLDLSRRAGADGGFGVPGSILTTERLGLAESYARDLLFTVDVAARQGRVSGHAATEADVTAGALWRLSRAVSFRPSASFALRHDLPGSAPHEARLMLSLVWTP